MHNFIYLVCVCVCVCVNVQSFIMHGCWSRWMIDDSKVMDAAHAGSNGPKTEN